MFCLNFFVIIVYYDFNDCVINCFVFFIVGILNIRWFGIEGDYNVLVFDFLGLSFEDFFNFCSWKFFLKIVFMFVD